MTNLMSTRKTKGYSNAEMEIVYSLKSIELWNMKYNNLLTKE